MTITVMFFAQALFHPCQQTRINDDFAETTTRKGLSLEYVQFINDCLVDVTVAENSMTFLLAVKYDKKSIQDIWIEVRTVVYMFDA